LIEQSVNVSSFFEPGAAALLVQAASKFSCHISLRVEEKTANAKSIMGIISLGLKGGQAVTIIADGSDEQQAVPELEHFLQSAGKA